MPARKKNPAKVLRHLTVVPHDAYPGKCREILHIPTPPFVSRCDGSRLENNDFCVRHSAPGKVSHLFNPNM